MNHAMKRMHGYLDKVDSFPLTAHPEVFFKCKLNVKSCNYEFNIVAGVKLYL